MDKLNTAKAVFEDWELIELEWQDEREDHIRKIENPTPQINAQLSQTEKKSRFETLHIKAQTHAEGLHSQLKLIGDNLATPITNRALAVIKEQIAATEKETDEDLWEEYEGLIDLDPDQRQLLSQEFVDSKKIVTDAAAILLTTALGLLPASPVASTLDSSIFGVPEPNTSQST